MKEQIYTLADLQAMANDDLNALAAELRELKRIGGDNGGGDWLDEFDDFYDEVFIPTTDRNQSGELLEWATAKGAEVEISLSTESSIDFRARRQDWQTVEGASARAETIAFCAAMLAMAGRLV